MNSKSNIPWPLVNIDHVTEMIGGGTPSRSESRYWNGSIPWLTPTSMSPPKTTLDQIDADALECITEEGLRRSSTRVIPVGSVIYSTRATIGKVGINTVPLCTNQGFTSFLPDTNQINERFLGWLLLWMTPQIESLCGSTTFKEVSKTSLRQIEIPLPPLAEQHRIVEILDQADTLRQQRRQADALSQRILPALFHEMFGNLDTNSKGWYKESLEKLTMIDAPFVSPLEHNYLDLPHIGPDSIEKATGKLLQWRTAREDGLKSGKFLFDSSHVLYSKIRPNLRKVAIPEFEGLCSADVYPVRPSDDRTTREFLLALLLSDHFTEYTLTVSARANMPKVNREQFGAYQAIVPDQQSMIKFSYSVQKLLPLGHNWKTSSATLETLFQTLLHRAFDGSLTAQWREGHSQEILQEMQSRKP